MNDQPTPTPTPRTDLHSVHWVQHGGSQSTEVVLADFARELERELRFNEKVSKQIFAANERLKRELDALAFAAARVEWKYGRTDDGKPKDWKEWNDLRECLGDRVRQPQELGGEQ